MDKMLVAVFDSDTAAFDGLSALRDLHRGWRYYALWMGGDRQGQDREDQRQAGP